MQVAESKSAVNLPDAQVIQVRLFGRISIQISGGRSMLSGLEPAGAVRIERFGCLTARGVELIGAPGVDPYPGVSPRKRGYGEKADG
jgi:hypothetical protein